MHKSKKPRRQRKLRYAAPAHRGRKFLSVHLSSELKDKCLRRTLPLRSGDSVLVMRGDYAGVEGKVTGVDPRRCRIRIEGVTREKTDGTAITVPLHPSKVMLTKLNLDDKWRKSLLESRSAAETAGEVREE